MKPFVDLSLGLTNIEFKSIIFIHEDEKLLLKKILNMTKGSVDIVIFNDSNFENKISEVAPEYIMVEDDLNYMTKIVRLKGYSIKKIVFVQYLFGVNTNNKVKRKKSLKLTLGSFFPWSFIIQHYRRLLSQFDYIISNSQTCGYLLRQFYDLPVSGIVYPPVGVDMRSLLDSSLPSIDKRGILAFVGDIKNDYFLRDIPKELAKLKTRLDESVRLFASEPITAGFFRKLGFDVYDKLSVEKLVSLMQSSKVTYVPTAYELFGYVGAESVLCGTPVILDSYHPFIEKLPSESKSVTITNPKSDLAEIVTQLLNTNIEMDQAKKAVFYHYSAEQSARSLISILKNEIVLFQNQ